MNKIQLLLGTQKVKIGRLDWANVNSIAAVYNSLSNSQSEAERLDEHKVCVCSTSERFFIAFYLFVVFNEVENGME